MKVEIWYDPVRTEIKTRINDCWQDEKDIYGFLYPVRHYPMQAWLREAGSWSGLGHQLIDLSRGEKTKLIFYGRSVDYADLCNALKAIPQIQPKLINWDTIPQYQAIVEDTLQIAENLVFPTAEGQNVFQDILHPEENDFSWASVICEEKDWINAEKSKLPCIILDEYYPISYDTLHRLERLTYSLRRPADAICCFFEDADTMALFENYAEQYPRMRYTFCLRAQGNLEDHLKEKYGIPYQLRLRLNMLKEISGKLDLFVQNTGATKQRRMELEYKKVDRGLSRQEQRELAQLADISAWLSRAEHIIDNIRKMADLHLINTLEKGHGK